MLGQPFRSGSIRIPFIRIELKTIDIVGVAIPSPQNECYSARSTGEENGTGSLPSVLLALPFRIVRLVTNVGLSCLLQSDGSR